MDFGILQVVPITSIEPNFATRGRKLYEHIEDLASDIAERGLMNPITVYGLNGNPPYKLIAGGRRLKACLYLKYVQVPVRIYDKPLSDLELKILELYENIKRADLTFAEKVSMTNEINEAFIALKGEKISKIPGAPGHSQRDTATLLGRSQGSVQQDIALAQAIKRHPGLGLENSKNQAAAQNTLKRMKRFIEASITAPSLESYPLASSFIVGDFFKNELLKESFTLLEVDPPYGVDLVKNKKGGDNQVLEGEYEEVPKELYLEFLERLIPECHRIGTKDSWLLLWVAPQYITLAFSLLYDVGYKTPTRPAIWQKGGGQTRDPKSHLGSSYEMFIYARKGEPRIRKEGRSNIFTFPPIPPQQKIHPAERPLELILELLDTFCWPNATIGVPFAGSGNTILAAHQRGFSSLGFDLSEEMRKGFLLRVAKMEGPA